MYKGKLTLLLPFLRTGKSVEYKSYPLMYNKAFCIETEGHLLNGAEFKVYTDDGAIKQELAKKHNDSVWTVHELLSDKLLNNPQKEIGEVEIHLTTEVTPVLRRKVVAAQVYQPQKITFQVQVPSGVFSGQQIQVQHPQTNQMLLVTVPNGVQPGGVFNVEA